MLRRFEEFLGVRAAAYERIAHTEAFTAQEEAEAAHISGWSWAKVVIVTEAAVEAPIDATAQGTPR